MAIYQDDRDIAEEQKKKKKALEGMKLVTDIQHSAKAIDMMNLDNEGAVDRTGKCPTCGK